MFCDKESGPDLGVEYSDCGPHEREMAELYSYSEYKDFSMVSNEFSLFLEEKNNQAWTILSEECKIELIHDLLSQLSYSDRMKRRKALCCLMYLAQGTWAELANMQDEERKDAIMGWLAKDKIDSKPSFNAHYRATKSNILLLHSQGLLPCLVQLLNMEAAQSNKRGLLDDPNYEVTMKDTIDLRLCLNLLYTLLEVMRTLKNSEDVEDQRIYSEFRHEISTPVLERDEELLLVKLFNLLMDGSNGTNECLPLKKVLLCMWKVILISFGDFESLEQMRVEYREAAGLQKHFEHTLQVLKEKLPALKVPLTENQNNMLGDQKDLVNWENGGEVRPRRSILRPSLLKVQTILSNSYEDDKTPPEVTPLPTKLIPKLAWRPKMDERELQAYVRSLRMKYFGLDLPYADVDTLFGFPESVQEGIKILKQNLYTPLSDVQLREEEHLSRHFMLARGSPLPLGKPNPTLSSNAEVFYEAAWRDMRQYIITLLKVMLAATPMSVEKDKYLNIDAETDAKISYGSLNHMLAEIIGSDIKRHKELLVKTISSIIILLLKHYKLNHVLQFENLGGCLMSGNCLPFIIKYFNQNMDSLVLNTQTSAEVDLEYPRCVRTGDSGSGVADDVRSNDGSQGGLQATSSNGSSSATYSSTIVITCINLLRIMNKLVKNKQSRIIALIYFKSFASLKSLLRIRHNVLQFYALKLIKLQSRYQGRQWRKVNIKILGYVFAMVRHRFHDDWAYGNELENKQQLDSQADEAALKRIVLRFNKRRYINEYEPDFVPGDYSVSAALGQDKELGEEFEKYWQQWTEQKVIESDFDWDQLTIQNLVM